MFACVCVCVCEYAFSCAHKFIHRVSDLNPDGGQWKVSLHTKENTAHLRQHYLSPHLSVYPSPNLSLVPPSSCPPPPAPPVPALCSVSLCLFVQVFD